jgi:repressor LexA
MHHIQESILQCADKKNLGAMTLREIGELIGEKYPQKVKHHLLQLTKKGLLKIDKKRGIIEKASGGRIEGTKLLSIPILGTANCGPATFFAEPNYQGYLKISASLLKRKQNIYAVKADGISMNRAMVAGATIDDGDYLIVDSSATNPEDGEIIVSVFDDIANVKRFRHDKTNNRVALLSESTIDFPPIFIHEDEPFHVAGKVVQVIKKPSFD